MISTVLRALKVAAFVFGAVAVSEAIRGAGSNIAEAIAEAAACHCEDCSYEENDEAAPLLDDVDVELDEETVLSFEEIAGELSELDEAGDALAAEHDPDELDDTAMDDDEFDELDEEGNAQ